MQRPMEKVFPPTKPLFDCIQDQGDPNEGAEKEQHLEPAGHYCQLK